MTINSIVLKTSYDSRGEKTVLVELTFKGGLKTHAEVPSGKSRGIREAAVLSLENSGQSMQILSRELAGKTFKSLKEFDKHLLSLDKTPTKEMLGGNICLGASIAFARGLAAEKKVELWQVLNQEFFGLKTVPAPYIFSNLINGGAHAMNSLNIQEFMVVVDTSKSLSKSIESLIAFYRQLGEIIKADKKITRLVLGDEGGYSLDFRNNEEPINLITRVIAAGRYNGFKIGLDVAASNFHSAAGYSFEGEKRSADEMLHVYEDYHRHFPLLMSIEDPFEENDAESFVKLTKKLGKEVIVVGDDLTTTNHKAIDKLAKAKAITGVIIKANQIGTLTETCEAIISAKKHGVRPIISHRSGETGDNFLIHIARASGAYGVKIGAPARERLEKYNELLRIYP